MMPGTDDLKARRQTRFSESGSDCSGGMAGEVKRVCKCYGAEQWNRFAVNF